MIISSSCLPNLMSDMFFLQKLSKKIVKTAQSETKAIIDTISEIISIFDIKSPILKYEKICGL